MQINKLLLFIALLFCGTFGVFANQQLKLKSPNARVLVDIAVTKEISYSVSFNNKTVLLPSSISLSLDKAILGKEAVVKSTKIRSNSGFNELTINFTNSFAVVFRAYNEGVAYRFITTFDGNVRVLAEQADFNLTGEPAAVIQKTDNYTTWEGSYVRFEQKNLIADGVRATTPALFDYSQQPLKVVIAESDLRDYPGMYIQKKEGQFSGQWAAYPVKSEMGSWGNFVSVVKERATFLVETSGKRSYPWRIVIITDQDKDLLTNHLVTKLAEPSLIRDIKWIKPGKASWEWWHDAILTGGEIPSGMGNRNTALYNYYVDFAAEHQMEYLMIDAGWSNNYDLRKVNPKLDVQTVISRAASKKVGVFLWCVASTLLKDLDGQLDFIQSLGAAGIKVDFIDRDDQLAIRWFEQIAKAAAKRKLMVNFHGCSKPTGLEKTYPNIVNYEAVRGAECSKWDYSVGPEHHLLIPFIRMLAGPMDYTPGSMRNASKDKFKPIDPGLPSSQGTRCHELAMFVVFNQPLAMLCDSPDEYMKYPDILQFLSVVPTVFEETKVLDAKIGDYILMAKRNQGRWYIGAMSNWERRTLELDFSFLPAGKTYQLKLYLDAADADEHASNYTFKQISVNSESKIVLPLAKGGGAAAYLDL
ncbi:glycoside hydrolase family 97 protein [Pedobacter sp. GR22-6]|uniref:glycoside hydrolase family 97 protein n=1 Tax=Pedobacter sp. GR22-6 TaxID=3127957 RepID=UPI00307DDBA9